MTLLVDDGLGRTQWSPSLYSDYYIYKYYMVCALMSCGYVTVSYDILTVATHQLFTSVRLFANAFLVFA